LTVLAAVSGTGTIGGTVIGPDGAPVANAQVFCELGLEGPLDTVRTDAEGRFTLTAIGAGTAGIFVASEGLAYGGATVPVAIGTVMENLTITLAAPATLRGIVQNPEGQPIAGATVSRVALLGDDKVAIPLSRLAPFSFPGSTSDAQGAFAIPNLPEGGMVALKVQHPNFALEGLNDVTVGEDPVVVTMYKGVVLNGKVVTRSQGDRVANATIVFSNAQPPHDTSFARTNGRGEFAVRLKRSVYQYKADSAEYQSPAWQRVILQGSTPADLTLVVSKLGRVHGVVRDAKTEAPVEGARITLVAGGSTAGVMRTGPLGTFQAVVADGTVDLHLEPAPGYQGPARPGLRLEVTEGSVVEVPTFWLAPIPPYRVRVVDPEGVPVSGAALRMLRPEQMGWHVTDADGYAKLAIQSLPPHGRLIGVAEHPEQPWGALFDMDLKGSGDAVVQLRPLGTVAGHVTTDRGKNLEGAVVGIFFAESASADPLLLWRMRTGTDGAFSWAGALPRVPLRCIAYGAGSDAADGETPSGESATIFLEEGAEKDVGAVVVAGGKKSASQVGQSLAWSSLPQMCGSSPDASATRGTVVTYCASGEAVIVIETMSQLRDILGAKAPQFAVVVDGSIACEDAPVPVMQGPAPSQATTYFLNDAGRVVHESFGLPTFDALRRLSAADRP
jgi:hypothetical protein